MFCFFYFFTNNSFFRTIPATINISLSFKAFPTHFFQLDFRISLQACSKVTIGTSGAEDSAKHFLNKGPSSPHRPIERLRSTLRNGKWRNTKWKSTQLQKHKQKQQTTKTLRKKRWFAGRASHWRFALYSGRWKVQIETDCWLHPPSQLYISFYIFSTCSLPSQLYISILVSF